MPIALYMPEQVESKSKHIDNFLDKSPKVLQKINQMVDATNEFPMRQNLLYSLMNLTNDVRTFSAELINRLAEHDDLASRIIEKARIHPRLNKSTVSAAQLKASIQKLGYGLVHNEIQDSLAKQYIKVYYKTENQDLKLTIRKSIRLAFIAKELAKMVQLKDTTLAYFAGLNYSLGEMILSLRDPRSAEELKKLLAKGVEQKTAELTILGFDLSELSARIMHKWDLSEDLISLVKNKLKANEVPNQLYKYAILMRFAEYLTKSLSDKNSSPQASWDRAQEFMAKLDVSMNSDTWIEEIKLMYIRLVETEYKLLKR